MPNPSDPARTGVSSAALPSRTARFLAFGAIVAAGLCGGLIGYAITDLQTDSSTAPAIGGVVGAVVAAVGVAIVSVLALRAMSEWKTIEERRATEDRRTGGSAGDRSR